MKLFKSFMTFAVNLRVNIADMNILMEKAEHYMAFIKYPESLRKHVYTTNSVESINSLVEKIRIRSGGYFNSVEVLEINIYLQRENLRRTKWKKRYQ